MPAISFTSAFSRTIRFGSWFLGKSKDIVEEDEEFCVLEDDVSYPLLHNIPLDLDAALTTLPQHSPLGFLELSLLCTVQGIASYLRSRRLQSSEVEILLPTPTISLTLPTPQKRKPKADSDCLPLYRTSPALLGH
ncbi:hypothetical protein CPB85DRAFT_1563061 [Mucidula mucida]|nr:hypothetical protein CPB85DRAFT_1563061 [Mucidula mucida]